MAALDTNAMRNRATGIMAGFSPGQKAVVVVATVMLVIGGVFFAQWAAKPSMTPLFSNLSQSDASSITAALQKSGKSYTLADGGSTVMVAKSDVNQLRLDMAGQNLPAGGSQGYKLLDKGTSITQSEFSQRVDYQRAVEGELANTIGSINGVQGATVHLVIPQNDVFTNDAVKPTASILVKTAPGKTLSSGTVQSIVNLAASSVEGLTSDNVTLADSNGKLLSAQGQTGGDSSDVQTAQTASMESELNAKIQSLLTPLVGEGKAVVQARAELNWDKVTQQSEVYNPNNKPVTASSSSNSTENYAGNGSSTSATGCIGTGTPQTAACTTPAATGAGGSGAYTKSDVKQDNAVDKEVTSTQKAQGTPTRITVAVLLDSSVPNIDPVQIQNLVTQAAGLQTARGDTVAISRMPFDTSGNTSAAQALKDAAKAKSSAQMMTMIKTGATVFIILIVLIILFISTKKRASRYSTIPISMAELDAAMPALPSADDMLGAIEAKSSIEDISPEALERAKVDAEITDLIEKQPDEVASLLRSWLADRRN